MKNQRIINLYKNMYKSIVRPLLFLSNPEKTHRQLFAFLKLYRYIPFINGWMRHIYTYPAPYQWNNLTWVNRVGLSAGFDKAAEVTGELSSFGFGFIELGTVTPSPQKGNPRPRIFRLPACDSLISRTGFNNPGLSKFQKNLHRYKNKHCLIGININKDPHSEGQTTIDDFTNLFRALYNDTDYFTLNWDSVDEESFAAVLKALTNYRKECREKRLIFIKLPADIAEEGMAKAIELATQYGTEGFIATGPTMDRSKLRPYSKKGLDAIGPGGVSGKGIGNKSLDAVKYLRTHSNGNMLIIGAGGIMSPDDAKKMIAAGADLIQIYSAFIYSGPGIVKKIAKEIN